MYITPHGKMKSSFILFRHGNHIGFESCILDSIFIINMSKILNIYNREKKNDLKFLFSQLNHQIRLL